MALMTERWGESGPRVVLVHGSMRAGAAAFAEQKSFANRYRLVVPYRRGYGDNAPITRVDTELDAQDVLELMEDGAHLIGTSMGGIVAMIAAARRPEAVRSLMLIEPPAFPLALDVPEVANVAEAMKRHWAHADLSQLPEFATGFLAALKYSMPLPSPLPRELEISIRNLTTERPWRCDVPIGAIADSRYPKSVVCGDWSAAFAGIAKRLAGLAGAELRIVPGATHAVQFKNPEFNDYLTQFLLAAERPR